MNETNCGLAAETKLETPEGAMAVRSLVDKNVSVFTREPSGRTRFRRMLDVRLLAEAQPVVRITLATGEAFRVAAQQIVYKKGMIEVRADALQPGDPLVPAFHYKESYEYRDDRTGTSVVSEHAIHVQSVEAAGSADIYSLRVNRTGNFVVSAGVLCKAEGS